ncbi:terminase small subunit [Pusillimonas sp. SM2304]|uniref:terminase small subunit n=1 Tax=Pusillimonas sp. SM2304 TaxID=3073241 RepID=UPI002875E064|nr:terminase small subunit [Pusillimonas sp. SM2304]MDS1141724.1 terminase small subunit [Pusillimonas sp. SM2304]
MSKQKLTIKQEKFCLAWLETGNASEAYRRSHNTSRMKPASVTRCATQLTQNPKIIARMAELRGAVAEEAVIDQAKVLSELAALAFYDPADLVLVDEKAECGYRAISRPEDLKLLPKKVRLAISGWSWDRGGNFCVRLANKTVNIELIGKYLGMFIDRKEVRIGDLEKASDADLQAKMVAAAREVAEIEGISVEAVLGKMLEAPEATVH